MSFTNFKPGGWAQKEKLTSAQLNTIQANMLKSADKSSAGDTIAGRWTWAGAGKGITLGASTDVTWGNGSTALFENGSNVEFEAGSELVAVLGADSEITLGSGCLFTISTAVGMDGSIETAGAGRFRLGANDWPVLVSGHTGASQSRIVMLADQLQAGSTGWTQNATGSNGVHVLTNTSTANNCVLDLATRLHHGATLDKVEIYFQPATGHAGLPSSAPSMLLKRFTVGATGASLASSEVDLSTVPTQSYSPVSLADQNNGTMKKMTQTCNQNNTIDCTQQAYALTLGPENGANALTGAIYISARLQFTSIADMRFR